MGRRPNKPPTDANYLVERPIVSPPPTAPARACSKSWEHRVRPITAYVRAVTSLSRFVVSRFVVFTAFADCRWPRAVATSPSSHHGHYKRSLRLFVRPLPRRRSGPPGVRCFPPRVLRALFRSQHTARSAPEPTSRENRRFPWRALILRELPGARAPHILSLIHI